MHGASMQIEVRRLHDYVLQKVLKFCRNGRGIAGVAEVSYLIAESEEQNE
jgi:hypothetical protein